MKCARMTNRCAGAGVMAVVLLVAAGCSEIAAPPSPAPGRSIHAPAGPPDKLISPNIDLDQQDLILHYNNGTITGSGSGASLIGSTAISIANNSYTSAVVSTADGQKSTSLIGN